MNHRGRWVCNASVGQITAGAQIVGGARARLAHAWATLMPAGASGYGAVMRRVAIAWVATEAAAGAPQTMLPRKPR